MQSCLKILYSFFMWNIISIWLAWHGMAWQKRQATDDAYPIILSCIRALHVYMHYYNHHLYDVHVRLLHIFAHRKSDEPLHALRKNCFIQIDLSQTVCVCEREKRRLHCNIEKKQQSFPCLLIDVYISIIL